MSLGHMCIRMCKRCCLEIDAFYLVGELFVCPFAGGPCAGCGVRVGWDIHVLVVFGLEVKSVGCVCICVVSESFQYSGVVSIDFRFDVSFWVQLIHRVVVEYEAETLSRSHSAVTRKNKASETLSCMGRNYLPDQCYSLTVTRTKTVIVRLAM
jgi:hypothetical protein